MTSLKVTRYNYISKDELLAVCNKSKYIYIPLIIGNDQDITLLVKKGDYVFKGTKIGKTKGKFSIPICSSVSGSILDFEEKVCSNGKKVKCVKIENDYKERKEMKKDICHNINKYKKEEFYQMIKEMGIIEFNEESLAACTNYSTNIPIKTLIINTLNYRSYINSSNFIIKNYLQELLETIDTIMELYKIKECYIVISKKNKIEKRLLNSFIGTYPKMKLFEVMKRPRKNYERKLVKQIKHLKYKFCPLEKGMIIHNIPTIYAIYEVLKYSQPPIHKFVTFIIDNKEIRNINLKIGTPITDVIDSKFYNREIYFITNNNSRRVIYDDNIIVTPDLDGIIILPFQTT